MKVVSNVKILLLSVPLLLQRMLPVRSSTVEAIARDLRVVVGPKREGWLGSIDLIGRLEVALICRCAANEAAGSWSQEELTAFGNDLTVYAADVERFNAQSGTSFPKRSSEFARRFEEFVPHILSCERKIGGEGVQF